jgi:hypothetical protein
MQAGHDLFEERKLDKYLGKDSDHELALLEHEEFERWFASRDEIFSAAAKYKWIHEWFSKLNEKQISMVVKTCTVFSNHPLGFMVTGKTKAGQGDGEKCDDRLIQFLPRLTKQEFDATAKGDGGASFMKNRSRLGVFKYVNMEKTRTIFLLAWLVHHSSVGSGLNSLDNVVTKQKFMSPYEYDNDGFWLGKPGPENAETRRIRQQQLERFYQQSNYHSDDLLEFFKGPFQEQ